MRRFPVLLASSVLCALLSVGCKQDVGGRCEQDSDCASGYCNGKLGRTFAMGGTCAPGPISPGVDAAIIDAARADTASADVRGDASDASDGATDVSSDASPGIDAAPEEVGTDADGATGG